MERRRQLLYPAELSNHHLDCISGRKYSDNLREKQIFADKFSIFCENLGLSDVVECSGEQLSTHCWVDYTLAELLVEGFLNHLFLL